MATQTSILIQRQHEPTWEELKETLNRNKIEFNSLFNSILPNLNAALRDYNPETKSVKIDLGKIQIS